MYDFDTLIDRTGTGACKWERRSEAEKEDGILAMSVADMELPAPPEVREALVRAAEHGIYGYTDPTDAYFDAVAGWMHKRHGVSLTARDIVPISGVVPAISIAIRAFSLPGDGVIVQPPVYYPFYSCVTLNGRQLERCALLLTADGYRMDFEALERIARKPTTRLMLLCSPHNPVGRVWTDQELRRVLAICRAYDVLVLSDEIHADLTMTARHLSFSKLNAQARVGSITFVAPSKTFNVPGLQCANALIFDERLRARFKHQARVDGFDNIPYFGRAGAIAAYTGGEAWLGAAIEYIKGNYELLKGFLAVRLPQARLLKMEGTYLAWIDFRWMGMDAPALERFMRKEARLILSEGYVFGEEGAGFERINLALPRAQLERALIRLADAWDARK